MFPPAVRNFKIDVKISRASQQFSLILRTFSLQVTQKSSIHPCPISNCRGKKTFLISCHLGFPLPQCFVRHQSQFAGNGEQIS